MQAVVFGATSSAKELYKKIAIKYTIVCYVDNDKNKWGKEIDNVVIRNPEALLTLEYDEVIIISLSAMNAIKKQLLDYGIAEKKINTTYIDSKVKAREQFVRDFAYIIHERYQGGVIAEAGVFQGEFASILNDCFPDRTLYLFDTFEGFDERDIAYESANQFSTAAKGHLNITSEELVLSKMKHPEKCIIKKGYFPETAKAINESFCYVNLDMDLYKPTLEGLRFFYPLLVHGGIITVHDFFSEGYNGVNEALKEFLRENPSIVPFPIGDGVSIAIQKR